MTPDFRTVFSQLENQRRTISESPLDLKIAAIDSPGAPYSSRRYNTAIVAATLASNHAASTSTGTA